MEKDSIARASVLIEAKAEAVWNALIDPAKIKVYLFGTEASSDWKEGSPITYRGVWKGEAYEDKGRILEVKPGRLLRSTYWSAFSGLPDLPENYNNVTYQLIPEGDFTRLSVIQDNNRSEEGRRAAEANWGAVLSAMKDLLEK